MGKWANGEMGEMGKWANGGNGGMGVNLAIIVLSYWGKFWVVY